MKPPLKLLAVLAIMAFFGHQKFIKPRHRKPHAPLPVIRTVEMVLSAEAAGFSISDEVVVYGPEHPLVGVLMGMFKMRGFKNVRHELITRVERKPGSFWSRLEEAGILASGQAPTFPIAEQGGRFYTLETARAKLAKVPVGREQEGPYVVVYGTSVCSVTTALRRQLDARGVKHDFRDFNDHAMQGEYIARVEAGGISFSGSQFPIVDVSGKVLMRPTVDAVLQAR